mmetsp:Transcript_23049/g.51236  ORF Transcript_23049/g.51236 Transcript_23049/m.51236 type:complete len:180 (+) Transcript_23049:204-743(+)
MNSERVRESWKQVDDGLFNELFYKAVAERSPKAVLLSCHECFSYCFLKNLVSVMCTEEEEGSLTNNIAIFSNIYKAVPLDEYGAVGDALAQAVTQICKLAAEKQQRSIDPIKEVTRKDISSSSAVDVNRPQADAVGAAGAQGAEVAPVWAVTGVCVGAGPLGGPPCWRLLEVNLLTLYA